MTTTSSLDPIQGAGLKAARLTRGDFRSQTTEARGWVSDCWTRLHDGRLTSTLGAAEVWFLVERHYEGGIVAFLADGGLDTFACDYCGEDTTECRQAARDGSPCGA